MIEVAFVISGNDTIVLVLAGSQNLQYDLVSQIFPTQKDDFKKANTYEA